MSTQQPTGESSDRHPADSTKEYLVQNMPNWSVFIFVLAAPFSLFVAGGIALAFDGSVIALLVGIVAEVALMILLYRYLQQKILVTVGQSSIHIHYMRSPFFVSALDMDLLPEDVESYKFDNFSGARFILYMKDGRRFKAAVGSVGKTDAIEQMAEHIIAILTDTQRPQATTAAPPRRRATYAEGTTGLVLAFVCIAAIITMGIAIVFYPENHNTSDTVRGVGVMFTCFAFVLHVFNLRRKARKDE